MTDTGPDEDRAPDGPGSLDGPLRTESDPYAGEDLSTYPAWWRDNVEQFREYGLPPYRPPRFADGDLTLPHIEDLEDELGVAIRFQTTDPREGEWSLVVDGEPVATVDKRRVREGYTEYGLTDDEFERLVRESVSPDVP